MRKRHWWFVLSLLYAGWFQWVSWELSTEPVKGVLVEKLEGQRLKYEYFSHNVYSKPLVIQTSELVWKHAALGETVTSYGTYLPGVGFDPAPYYPDTWLSSLYGLFQLFWLGLVFTWCWFLPIRYLQNKGVF